MFDLIPSLNTVRNTRHSNNIPARRTHIFFSYKWVEQLDLEIRNSTSVNIFQKKLLNCRRIYANSISHTPNQYKIKLLKRLRLGVSHLHKNKFRHSRCCTCFMIVAKILKQKRVFQIFSTTLIFTLKKNSLNNIRNFNE